MTWAQGNHHNIDLRLERNQSPCPEQCCDLSLETVDDDGEFRTISAPVTYPQRVLGWIVFTASNIIQEYIIMIRSVIFTHFAGNRYNKLHLPVKIHLYIFNTKCLQRYTTPQKYDPLIRDES